MQKLTSMWKNMSKNGTIYYSGKLGNVSLIAFENVKQNDKQPDITIYVKDEVKKQESVGSYTEEETNESLNTELDPFEDFGEFVETDNLLD